MTVLHLNNTQVKILLRTRLNNSCTYLKIPLQRRKFSGNTADHRTIYRHHHTSFFFFSLLFSLSYSLCSRLSSSCAVSPLKLTPMQSIRQEKLIIQHGEIWTLNGVTHESSQPIGTLILWKIASSGEERGLTFILRE